MSATGRERVERLAQAVLDARAEHPGATLADLYDPDLMPANLRKAHRTLDAAVDRLYRPAPFGSDRERVEHLFGLYERMVAGFLATPAPAKRGRRKPPSPSAAGVLVGTGAAADGSPGAHSGRRGRRTVNGRTVNRPRSADLRFQRPRPAGDSLTSRPLAGS